jgi:hypothetical protein
MIVCRYLCANLTRLALLLRLLLLDDSILLLWPLSKNLTPHPDLITSHLNRALKIRTHAHTQLQLLFSPPQLLDNLIPRLLQRDEILVLVFRSRLLTPRNRTNGH